MTPMSRFSPKLPWGVRRLFRLPGNRERMLRDMDEEMRQHLAMRVDDLRARGMSQTEAEAEALRRFGDTAEFRDYAERRASDRARWLRVTEWIAETAQDVRFAWRQFGKAPAVTAIAVLTLALGIGANTAIFSVVHRLLLDPLPYPNGSRIVMPMQDGDRFGLGAAGGDIVTAWHERSRTIEAIAGATFSTYDVRPDGTINVISNAWITSNFLHVLGVQPVLGRSFTPDEEREGGPAVAMISHGLWQREYGGTIKAIGSTVTIEGAARTIVGVTPPGLTIPMSGVRLIAPVHMGTQAPDIWIPATLEAINRGGGGGQPGAFATLRPGASSEAASRELASIAESVPTRGRPRSVRAMRAQDFLDARETRSVQVLFVAVGALLLIACANVANLLLARAWTRRREFAVRTALGAGRGRLARQVLTESMALALAGGVLGVGVAWQTLKIIIALRPSSLDHLDTVRIEPAVLLWTLGVSVATGILFGCAPALFAIARKVGDVLRNETRGGSGGRTSRRFRSGLIVIEIALSIVLLVGAGLLVRSFVQLQQMHLGFEPRGLAYVTVMMGGSRNRARLPAIRQTIVDRVRALPGVTDIVLGTMPGKGYVGDGLETEHDANGQTNHVTMVGTNFISPDYFRVARIAFVEGRAPDSLATPGQLGPGLPFSSEVVVNRTLARRLWPDGRAIGARVRSYSDPDAKMPPGFARPPAAWSTVVGVVDDIQLPGLRGDARTMNVYSLFPPNLSDVPFVVRTAESAEEVAPTIHRTIVEADRRVLVRPILSGEAYLRDALAPSRFAMALLAAFAVIALVLSAVGLYGIIAYSVTLRTREIGVRIALGAEPRAVTGLVIGGGLRLAVGGVVIGAAAAAATTRLLGSMLYGVGPADPFTFVAITVLVAVIALLASYVPARRALRINPTEALRAD
jgi:putative ABC transport system permease protein